MEFEPLKLKQVKWGWSNPQNATAWVFCYTGYLMHMGALTEKQAVELAANFIRWQGLPEQPKWGMLSLTDVETYEKGAI